MIEAKILKPGYTQKEALVLLFNTDPKLSIRSSAVSGHSGKRPYHEKAEQAV